MPGLNLTNEHTQNGGWGGFNEGEVNKLVGNNMILRLD